MKIGVVIPCRNEVKNIEECIRAIFASELPESLKLEVTIVDGKSDDGTLEIISKLQQEFPSLQLVVNEKMLTPFAFNLGIYASPDANFYQIIGARQVISKHYLSGAIQVLNNDPSIWCVGGAVENVYLNEQGKLIAKAMSTALGMGLGNFRTLNQSAFVDTVGTPMYPAWVFEKIGYFDEDLVRNQDDEYNFRVTKAGGKIFFDHTISLKYYVRGKIENLWKQFLQYGYWKVYVNSKHQSITTSRQLIPPLFVTYLLIFPFLFLLHPVVGAIAAVPFMIYLMLVTLVAIKISDRSSLIAKVWIIFPILHISYGWGYLKGIFRFLLLKKPPNDQSKSLSR